MDLLLATNNTHKRRELNRILSGHRVLLPGDIGVDFSFEETGDTFLDNALGKARALHEMVARLPQANGFPVVADDSGLCVDALDGRPGVYSARYGSPDGGKSELPAAERNAMLLAELGEEHGRSAHFVCCMVVLFAPYRWAVVQETFDGHIARSPSGTGGFGYDPIFVVPGRDMSVAELPEDEKNRISHRARAATGIATILASPGNALVQSPDA